MSNWLFRLIGKLGRDKRAFTPVVGLIIAVIAGFFALSVLLPTGLITVASLNETISGMSSYTGTVKTQTITLIGNVFAGFSLMGITPLVMGAGAILTILMVSFSAYAYSQRD